MRAGTRLAAGLALLLAACVTPPPPSPAPRDVSFAELAPIRLDVVRARTVVEYVPPFASPHVEHLVPIAPAAAARQWAEDVLVPVGAGREAVFVVTDARVVEEALPPASWLKSLLQAAGENRRYRVELEARLEVRDADRVLASATASVSLARTLSDARSPTARGYAWYDQVAQAIGEFDQAIRPEIGRHLSPYLAR